MTKVIIHYDVLLWSPLGSVAKVHIRFLKSSMNRRISLATALGVLLGLWHPDASARTAQNWQPYPKDVSMIAIAPARLSVDKILEIDTYLNAYDQTGRLSGNVIIAPGTEPALVRSYGLANHEHGIANTPTTKFRIGSVTKQFTAVAILQLQEQGLVDVQAPIANYLPNYPNGDRITIHHLLTHTSGIPEYLNGETFPDILEWMRLPSTLNQLVERFQDLPLEFTPGERFKYSNSGYVLLTQILETVSGQPYADYMQTHIFTLLGMNNTGYEIPKAIIPNLAQGYVFLGQDLYLQSEPIDMSLPQGAGGLYSTLEDLSRWNQWLYGRATEPILAQASVDLLTTSAIKMDAPADGPDAFYGYGLVNDTHLDRQRIHHNGGINGFRSALTYYPEENLTISVLLNLEGQAPEPIAEGLAAILFGEPYTIPQPRKAVDLDPALYEKYVGTYQLLPELQLKLWVEDSQLVGQATGQETFILYPSSETEFFAQIVDITVKFSPSEDGTVTGLTLNQFGRDFFAPRISP